MPVMKQNGGLPVLAHGAAEDEKADKTKKAPSKKTFYCVMAEFYANGTVSTAITTRFCKEKPRNTMRVLPIMTAYNDWFESMDEAEAFLAARKTA
jgi:hypothetical protein